MESGSAGALSWDIVIAQLAIRPPPGMHYEVHYKDGPDQFYMRLTGTPTVPGTYDLGPLGIVEVAKPGLRWNVLDGATETVT